MQQDHDQFKTLDKESVRLSAEAADSSAFTQIIEVAQEPSETTPSQSDGKWLLVPRIKCDAPGPERLLLRPNIILGFVVGMIFPFVLLHLGLTYHQYINTYVISGLLIAILLFIAAQYKVNRYLTYTYRNPFFVEFAFGVMYPAAKLFSLIGVTWLESNCFVTLGDCMQEFNHHAYTAECNAKVLSFDKPLKVNLGAEIEYAQSLLMSGQSERAVHYTEERLEYWKYILGLSKNVNEQALADYTVRCYFAAIVYESIGELEKSIKLKEELYDRVKAKSKLTDSHKIGAVCWAESLYFAGNFEDAAKVLEDFFDTVEQSVTPFWETVSAIIKARAATSLALCYAHIGNDTKTTQYVDIARTETEKDRSTINKLNEKFMLAEIIHLKGNAEQAREILLGVKQNFLTEQSSHVAFLLKQKALDLGFTELFPELPEPAIPVTNEEDLCKHQKEECSYLAAPVKILTEISVARKALLAGCFSATVPFMGSLLRGTVSPKDTREMCILVVPLLIFLVLTGFERSRRMIRLRRSIRESTGIPVKVVAVDKFSKIEIYDQDRRTSIGKYRINEDFHTAISARIDGDYSAKMYKQDDADVLGLELFGYATIVSKKLKL
jgi:tetratricopeptide (TPR) repeat protein